MRKDLIVILMNTCLLRNIQAFNQQKQLKDLIGRWEIVGEQSDSASLEVIDSSTIILNYMGEKKGSLIIRSISKISYLV